ncbi:GPR1/FUN34/yaaH family-domain-containing protein [Thelonectria olida]|uniref:GPR1/FUN34/yaaH family-domain-containing protein n=1 Tax=Thelonectria olida TaxID=1576542 RepID=A0A9P8VYS1_9HYPO|nr:GPR1/FUN34/yaaH family-domain-containing protein [Thelonectria olida]
MSFKATDEEKFGVSPTPMSMTPTLAYHSPPLGERIGNPSAFAMAGFAVTLTAVSLAMMGVRGVETQNVFVADLCFVASIGLLISAQWELIRGATFSYTVLSAYALFYGGYGAIMLPSFGVVDAYGGKTPEYYNAMGFYLLLWAVLNIFFLIASLPFSFVYISIFVALEVCLSLDAASQFAHADGKLATSAGLIKASGVFAFISGLLGFYCVLHYLCQEALPFDVPMGDTSRFFARLKQRKQKLAE